MYFYPLYREIEIQTASSQHKDAIVGGEIVAQGTQPWIGVIGSTRFSDSANGILLSKIC